MNREDVKVGTWYWINYGTSPNRAECIAITDNVILMQFHWGSPWRIVDKIGEGAIIHDTTPPWWATMTQRLQGVFKWTR